MNTSKLLFLCITVLFSHVLQSSENSLSKEQVSQLWSNVHSEGIKYFNHINNFDTRPYFLRNAVLDNDENLVENLLRNGADITIADNQNATPWFYVVAKNNKNVMKLFLECGASLEIQDVFGLTPLHFVVKKDDKDAVQLLQEYLPTDAKHLKDDRGRTVLFYVQSAEMFELLKSMDLLSDINIQDIYGITPLHTAVRNHDSQMVKVLLQYGADITIKDYDRFTAWYDAVDNLSMINFSSDIRENDREIIKLFLNYEVNLKIQNTDGFTPLHMAVINNDVELVNILKDYLPHDAKNWKDGNGRMVLFYVQSTKMFELLESMGII